MAHGRSWRAVQGAGPPYPTGFTLSIMCSRDRNKLVVDAWRAGAEANAEAELVGRGLEDFRLSAFQGWILGRSVQSGLPA